MNNIEPFPKILRFNDKDVETKEGIEKLTDHYSAQLMQNLQHHGVEIDDTFLLDYAVCAELLQAAIFRAFGKYHPTQDILDDIIDQINSEIENDIG